MNPVPWILSLFAVYVAILNACSRNGLWHIGHGTSGQYSEVQGEGEDQNFEASHCGGNGGLMRSLYDRLDRPEDFNVTDDELQDVILTLWEKDKKGRADGLYTTDWQYRLDNNIARDAPLTGKFFKNANHDALMKDGERFLLWKLFEAYDTDDAGKIQAATINLFNKATSNDPFQYIKQYLKRKDHPMARDHVKFDKTVKCIWTEMFQRKHVNSGPSTGVRHYLGGERRTDRKVMSRTGQHHWSKLYYLDKNNRLIFRGYGTGHQHPRILSIIYDSVEFERTIKPYALRQYTLGVNGETSTMIGTSAGFDIAWLTLLYFTRPEKSRLQFCLGDGAAFEVVVGSVADKNEKVPKFVGSMFARPIGKKCPPKIQARMEN